MTEIGKLAAAAKSGDQQAMTALYEQSCRRAYYLALQLLKDEDEAQDILQESFIKAFSNLDTLQEPDKFQSWLGRIVSNKCKDYLKKKKPRLFTELDNSDDEKKPEEFEDESGQFSPDAAVDYKETKRLVQEMIDELPEEQRIAIVFRYLEDLPVKQIAEIMECSEGTIKSRLNYGRKAIKEKVLDLEKKGTKLYCMPLIPFLCWMYRQDAWAASIPVAAKGAGAVKILLDSAEKAGTTGMAGTSGTAAGKAGLSILGKTVSMKAAAIGTAIVVGSGAAAGGVYIYNHEQSENAAEMEAGSQQTETLMSIEAMQEETEPESEKEEPAEENSELQKVIAEYGNQLDCIIDVSAIRDAGDSYEIQAMIVAPFIFEENPMEGKSEGDVIPIEVSRLQGRTADFKVSDPVYEVGVEDMACYQDEESGNWSFIGPNDMTLGTEVYNGMLKLSKDAEIQVFDYSNIVYTDGGWEGYEAITSEELIENPQNYEIWGMVGELKVPEDEMRDVFEYNPETGKIENMGQELAPGYVTLPAPYEIFLNSEGVITAMERNYLP